MRFKRRGYYTRSRRRGNIKSRRHAKILRGYRVSRGGIRL